MIFSKLISELILVAIVLIHPGSEHGKFELTDISGGKIQVTYDRSEISQSLVEGMHEYTVVIKTGTPLIQKYRFVDNGLYRVYTDENNMKNSYELDIINILTNLKKDKITELQQTFKTATGKDRIIIKPHAGGIMLSLEKNKSRIFKTATN